MDGLDVPTRANVTGFHRVRVVAYADDGDGRFERAADRRLDAATDARRFLLPDRSGAGPLSVSPNPAVAGTLTTLYFDLPVERSVSLRRVALLTDYPAGFDAVAASDVTVTAGDTAVAATTVSARRGVLVATLPRPLAVDADTTVEVSVGGVRAPDPAATGRVTLVANPERGALAGTTGLDAVRTTTPSSADGGGLGFLLPAAFPAFALLVGLLVVALALRERG